MSEKTAKQSVSGEMVLTSAGGFRYALAVDDSGNLSTTRIEDVVDNGDSDVK